MEEIAEQFENAFLHEVEKLCVGDPSQSSTDVGPLARADLREALANQVERSLQKGARLLAGGIRLERRGYFYAPTILTEVSPESAVYQEETFGPVAAIIRAGDEREAIQLANQSQYGLGASLWTKDIARARELAGEIQAGCVFVNGMVASDPRLPFGGVKRSGYGRELSEFGIREFVNIQTVWIA